jgi:hypothetical protein
MAKSKSSNSIVKSVESILPKGISLMHVILAIVLGLMMCTFFSNSDIIEGEGGGTYTLTSTERTALDKANNNLMKFGNVETGTGVRAGKDPEGLKEAQKQYDAIQAVYQASGTKSKQKVHQLLGLTQAMGIVDPGTTTGTTTGTTPGKVGAMSMEEAKADISHIGQKATEEVKQKIKTAAALAGDAISGGVSAWSKENGKKILDDQKDPNNQGICWTSSADLNQIKVCNEANKEGATAKDNCGQHDDCDWVECGKDPQWVRVAGRFAEQGYDKLLTCIGGSPDITNDNIKWNKSDPSISPGYGAGDKTVSGEDPTQWNNVNTNFLKYIGCSLGKGKNPKYTCKDSVISSDSIRKKIEGITDDCYDGWNDEQLKDVYKTKNGGEPIMSLTKDKGLVCRNPFYKTETIKVSEPRLVADGATCKSADRGCPCRTDAEVIYAHKDNIIDDHVVRLWDDWTGTRCQFTKYKSDNHWVWCAPHHLSDLMGGVSRDSISAAATSRQGTCTKSKSSTS